MQTTTPTAGRATRKPSNRRPPGTAKHTRRKPDSFGDAAFDLDYVAEDYGQFAEAVHHSLPDEYDCNEYEAARHSRKHGDRNRSALDAYMSGLQRYTPLGTQEEYEVGKAHDASRTALIHHLCVCPKTVEEIIRMTEVNAPAAKLKQAAHCREILRALHALQRKPEGDNEARLAQEAGARVETAKLHKQLTHAIKQLHVRSATLIAAVKLLGAPEQTQLDFGCDAVAAVPGVQRTTHYPSASVSMSAGSYAEFLSTAIALEKTWIIARNRLIEPNLRFVVYQLKGIAREGMSMADLIAEGNEALIEATDSYDFSRHNKLCSYAGTFINRKIRRAIDDKARLIRMPVHTCEDLRKIRGVTKKLEQQACSKVGEQQIAAETGFSEKKVRELEIWALPPKSIHAPLNDEGDQTIENTLRDPRDWREAVYGPDETRREMLLTLLLPLLPMMNECQRNVMAAMHGVYGSRPLSEEEAAVALQLSPNQFRAHHAAALSVIERHFRALSTEAA
jgi:RNA polymerase sigma factor (sigma-70 family)